jgi:DNA primase
MENEIKKYLDLKGISYREENGELVVKCVFSNCDEDSTGSEAHLYISKETGQYQCKKCLASGNLHTFKKHFGDLPIPIMEKPKNIRTITPKMVENFHAYMPAHIRSYLNERGISNEIINENKIGYERFYGKDWIAIPIKDIDGNYKFFKLREDPASGNSKMTSSSGIEAQIYSWDLARFSKGPILICEGEMDALLMRSHGIDAISSTHGAGTFKESWIEHLNPDLEYFICYDNDKAGIEGARKVAFMLHKYGFKKIAIITLPEEVGEKGDIGDYIMKYGLSIKDLFNKYAKVYPERIDTKEFKETTIEEVCDVLNFTIKKDDENKSIAFLTMLATYTDEAQTNVFFNAPSSTGKSHIPLAVADLFPLEDKIILANCSPTAFFHEQGKFDKETNTMIVDLSRKILIFTDMPDTGLISRLRPMLSHDAKVSHAKITDKNQSGGNRTKNIDIIGYPSVYFCSAGLKIDEQETTRFIMLSPSIEHDKIYQGIQQSIHKESNRESFLGEIADNQARNLLKKRILGIKQEDISDVKIENRDLIEQLFLGGGKSVKPRQQRDIKKIITIIKGFTLLNVWFRNREGAYAIATEQDILNGFKLWEAISVGQDYGLAPYVYEIYTKIILPLWNEPSDEWGSFSTSKDKKKYVTRKEVLTRHFKIYGRPLSMSYLRSQILPQLEQVGLILQEKGGEDHREMVIIPVETEVEDVGGDIVPEPVG